MESQRPLRNAAEDAEKNSPEGEIEKAVILVML